VKGRWQRPFGNTRSAPILVAAVSYATSTLCLAVTGAAIGRRSATYFDGGSWSAVTAVRGTGDNIAIACPAATKCVIATSGGQAIVGS
jgi:hypothetical protein